MSNFTLWPKRGVRVMSEEVGGEGEWAWMKNA